MHIHKGSRRTLSCLTCGAPVRKFEPIKTGEPPKPAKTPERINKHKKKGWHEAYGKKRKKKKRKSLIASVLDEVEDIFDFDIFD